MSIWLAEQRSPIDDQLHLREHFVLEKIAEELEIEPIYGRVRSRDRIAGRAERHVGSAACVARLEKTGQMDAVRNQIIERTVIERITTAAKVSDVQDTEFLKRDTESGSVDFLISGNVADIPEAEHDNDAAAFPGAPKLPEAEKE